MVLILDGNKLRISIPVPSSLQCCLCDKSWISKSRHLEVRNHLNKKHGVQISEFSYICQCSKTFTELRGTASHTKNCEAIGGETSFPTSEVHCQEDGKLTFILLMPSTQQRCHIPGCLFTSKATGTKIAVSFQHHFFRKHDLETLYRWKCRCGHLLSPKEARMKTHFKTCQTYIASLPSSPTPGPAPIFPSSPLEESTSESSHPTSTTDQSPDSPSLPVITTVYLNSPTSFSLLSPPNPSSTPPPSPINSLPQTPPILTEESSPTHRFNFPDDYPTTANSTFPTNDFPHLTSPINHSTAGDSPRISGNPLLTKWLPILSDCTPETKDEVISECIAEIVSHTKGSLETLPVQAFSRPKRKPRHQSREQQRARRARHHDPKDASFIQKLFNIYPKQAVNKVLHDSSPRYDGSLDTLTSFASSFVEPAHFKDFANSIKQEYDACQWTVPDESQTETLLSPPTRKEILNKLRRVSNTAPGHDKLEYRHLQKCDPSGRLIEALFRVVHELGVPSSWKKG